MNEKPAFILPERNPVTHAKHRREVLLQITVPLVIGGLLILLAVIGVIWTAAGAGESVSRWADISLMWLITPTLVFALLGVLVFSALVYLVTRLLMVLPGYARLAQDWFTMVSARVHKLCDQAAEPFLKAHSASAGARQARRSIEEQVREITNYERN